MVREWYMVVMPWHTSCFSCSRMASCRTYEMWKGLNDLISNYFGNITLADLALPDQAGNDYVI